MTDFKFPSSNVSISPRTSMNTLMCVSRVYVKVMKGGFFLKYGKYFICVCILPFLTLGSIFYLIITY